MLTLLILVPLIGAFLTVGASMSDAVAKRFGLAVAIATFWLSVYVYGVYDYGVMTPQALSMIYDPIPDMFAIDGVSIPFVLLTAFLTPVVLLAS